MKALVDHVGQAGQSTIADSTRIPVCVWFLAKNTNAGAKRGFRDRRKETFLIDTRTLATLRDALLPKLLSGELTVAQSQN